MAYQYASIPDPVTLETLFTLLPQMALVMMIPPGRAFAMGAVSREIKAAMEVVRFPVQLVRAPLRELDDVMLLRELRANGDELSLRLRAETGMLKALEAIAEAPTHEVSPGVWLSSSGSGVIRPPRLAHVYHILK